jgi:hypothetical protein
VTLAESIVQRLRTLVETMEVPEDRFVTEILLIMKTSNPATGTVGIVYNYDTKDWVLRKGMLDIAMDLEDGLQLEPSEEE